MSPQKNLLGKKEQSYVLCAIILFVCLSSLISLDEMEKLEKKVFQVVDQSFFRVYYKGD